MRLGNGRRRHRTNAFDHRFTAAWRVNGTSSDASDARCVGSRGHASARCDAASCASADGSTDRGARAGRLARSTGARNRREPYSLTALWEGGDFVARGTIIILVIMSMGTWYVLITKFVEQLLLNRQAREANRKFWNAASIRDGANRLGRRSAFRMVVE